ncbi:error-prone DNA polymerase [Steroidobacter denitrificans]|uniref:Error-prone DNA polymerase n=1 Tax=Steroidobacter denitrificans TaxID=465721 RepID=A0A127FAC0_STEDE|nr:error-prone DNA polymerase [Steroidobacter denitrificans]AMN46540.1 error-prone DNA polymerase [Steroidobacter denitrificans]
MYAELHARSNFSFLSGASHPRELVARATALGYRAMALTDECSLAGVVRAHDEARKQGLHLIIGSELRCVSGLTLIALARTRHGYGALSRLITCARRAAGKGSYRLDESMLVGALPECSLIWLPAEDPEAARLQGAWLRQTFETHVWIGVERLCTGRDTVRRHTLRQLSRRFAMPCVACGGVLMHVPERKPLHDVLTAIRLIKPVQECGYALEASAERHLRSISRLQKLYPPDLLAESIRIAEECTFSLDELRYEYPREIVPEGHTPTTWLRELTEQGLRERWPRQVPGKVRGLVEHELAVIAGLRYEPFFLTVYDLVREARERNILCQGRGSAANSTVCFCLGITAVDPSRQEMLFERFISRERLEPPDIDVDFEHERREEIIQYMYEKYGRHRAGLAATVVTYRRRQALRDVGKALGFDTTQIERLIMTLSRRSAREDVRQQLRAAGFDADSPLVRRLLLFAQELCGFPRHLSQHVGGFVIAAERLDSLVPIENAGMANRTVIQWDKDDLESLGLLKVDVLGLGILTAIRKTLTAYNARRGTRLTFSAIPAEDPATYEMIRQADTIGVFQIESRAQISMLPRLKPRCFYDLVIEVAIVRPGPIQGDMVHPYLRRRAGLEPVDYLNETIRGVLERTLGVPIFQEQVMRLAVLAAGFTPGEADQLRRAMAAWKRSGDLGGFRRKLLEGLRERGYPREFAERLYRQIQGFGDYGFPESHAVSFALIAYATSWLKRHAPAEYTAALLNSQPMGFYSPARLVRDARSHGVCVHPVDVMLSDWDCTLEGSDPDAAELRLGLRLVEGLSRRGAERLVRTRQIRVFRDLQDLVLRAQLNRADLESLAAADALVTLAGSRHHASWALAGVDVGLPLIENAPIPEATPLLPIPTEGQNIAADYRSLGLTLRRHPVALLRDRLLERGVLSAEQLTTTPGGHPVRHAGIVTVRQSPATANDTTFMTLEDETGEVNVIVWPSIARKYRTAFLSAQLLEVHGELQRDGGVMHLIAGSLHDRSRWLGRLRIKSRDFR